MKSFEVFTEFVQLDFEKVYTLTFCELEFMRSYYEATGNTNINVGGWDTPDHPDHDLERRLQYSVSLRLPSVLQNALGSVGDVALSEKQTRDKDKQNGYNITTHIEPQGHIINFRQVGKWAWRNNKLGGGCSLTITASVEVTQGAPWGMKGSMEGIMLSQTKQAMQKWIQLAQERVAMVSSSQRWIKNAVRPARVAPPCPPDPLLAAPNGTGGGGPTSPGLQRAASLGATPVCDPPPSPGPPLAGSPASLAGLGPGGTSSWRAAPASSLAYSSPHPYGGGVNALHCATALHLCALLVLGPMLAEHAVTRPDALHVFTAIVLASFMLCMLSSYGLLEYSRRATPHDAGAGDQARLGALGSGENPAGESVDPAASSTQHCGEEERTQRDAVCTPEGEGRRVPTELLGLISSELNLLVFQLKGHQAESGVERLQSLLTNAFGARAGSAPEPQGWVTLPPTPPVHHVGPQPAIPHTNSTPSMHESAAHRLCDALPGAAQPWTSCHSLDFNPGEEGAAGAVFEDVQEEEEEEKVQGEGEELGPARGKMGVSNDGDEGGGARGPHAVTPASAEESKAAKTSEPLAASMSEPPSPATLAGAATAGKGPAVSATSGGGPAGDSTAGKGPGGVDGAMPTKRRPKSERHAEPQALLQEPRSPPPSRRAQSTDLPAPPAPPPRGVSSAAASGGLPARKGAAAGGAGAGSKKASSLSAAGAIAAEPPKAITPTRSKSLHPGALQEVGELIAAGEKFFTDNGAVQSAQNLFAQMGFKKGSVDMEARADAPEESDAVGSPLDPSTRELGGDNKLRSTGAAVPQRATNKTTKEEDPGGQYINVKLVVLPSTSKAHDAKVLVQFSIAQLASKGPSWDAASHFGLPSTETPTRSFSAMNNKLVHGFVTVTQRFVCFDTVLFSGGPNKMVLAIDSIKSLKRVKFAQLFNNAIEISLDKQKVYFSGFLHRADCVECISSAAMKLGHTMKVS